jgi:hypothetical protein
MSRAIDIASYFQRYAWSCEVLEPNLWRASFTSERETDFDLYVMLGDDWVHFAVSPVTPTPEPACQARLFAALLMLNQQMPLIHFAVDEEWDINLLATLPRHAFAYRHFALALDTLVGYTQTLAHELGRLATEPKYYSPLIPTNA